MDPGSTLRDRLQRALGDSYQIERELGGGGMSHVFVAQETRLKRRVVIKLLPPEASAAVHADRFAREIELAASLSHPHIVPLHAAGEADGLLWYAMPFIEGESLADRIHRTGPLPQSEVVRIIRDVADALAEAHQRGVVHRDIKPANILLRGRHALVADFGVAKALAAGQSSEGDLRTLTGLGIALGTPAYMAPEQAAADPNIDHRADIYALGVVAYEALSGRLPFDGDTAQELIAAHIAVQPTDIRITQPTVSPELAEAVMRCLAKRPADRWKSAEALATWCDRQATPSGGAGIDPAVTSAHRALNTWSQRRILSIYPLIAGLGVVATFAVTRIAGLPDWIWWIATVMALLGLPVLWSAARYERRRARATITGMATSDLSVAALPWRSGRSAVRWGVAITGLVLLLGAGWLVTGAMGIGPAATLFSSGALDSGDRLLLADFDNRTDDPNLATSVVEALRVDLAQTGKIQLLQPDVVNAAMVRLGHDPSSDELLGTVARDVATAEGAKAIVEGEVAKLGSSYVLTARLVSTADRTRLAPLKETAANDSELIAAVNRLSRALRSRIGESLKSIRSSAPLERATTSSLAALQLYSEGVRVFEQGRMQDARDLLVRALEADSTFAMAYRKLAAVLFNLAIEPDLANHAGTRAFELRDRLPQTERLLAEATYYGRVLGDLDRSIAIYRTLLDIDPHQIVASHNLAQNLRRLGRFQEAREVMEAFLPSTSNEANWVLAAMVIGGTGDTLAAAGLSRRFLAAGGDSVAALTVALEAARPLRDIAAIESLLTEVREIPEYIGGEFRMQTLQIAATETAWYRGHLAEAGELSRNTAAALASDNRTRVALLWEWNRIHGDLIATGNPVPTHQALDSLQDRLAADSAASHHVPWDRVAKAAALAGDAERTRWAAAQYTTYQPRNQWRPGDSTYSAGLMALAEQRWVDAAKAFHESNRMNRCNPCGSYLEALAWDQAGNSDSVITILRRTVERPRTELGPDSDAPYLANALLRLGELEAERGERAEAARHLERFLGLWRNPDPELRPKVVRARQLLAQVSGEPL